MDHIFYIFLYIIYQIEPTMLSIAEMQNVLEMHPKESLVHVVGFPAGTVAYSSQIYGN